MFIKLTNSTPQHKGMKVILNTDQWVSVHRQSITREGATASEDVTFIFAPPHGTWEVEETPEQIESVVAVADPSKTA